VQARNLATQAEQRYLELADLGLAALRRDRFDEGVAAYARIQALGVPWIAEVGASLHDAATTYAATERTRVEAVNAERAKAAARHLPGKLTGAFTKVAALAKERSFDEALKRLQFVPDSALAGSNIEAVARARARFTALSKFWTDVQNGPPGALGMQLNAYGQKGSVVRFDGRRVHIRLASSGRTVPIAVTQLTDAQIVDIAVRAAGADWLLNATRYARARGEDELARKTLLLAQKAGADVTVETAELAAAKAVAAALDAAAQRKPDAVKQLTAVLDEHAASDAAILAYRQIITALKGLGGIPAIAATTGGPLPDALLRLKLLPKARIGVAPPANIAAAALASPLERASPVVLGRRGWTDYSVSLRWTVEEPADIVVFFRLDEEAPGRFRCGALAVHGERLELGRLDAGVYKAEAALDVADLSQRLAHRAQITVQGPTVLATVDDCSPLRMTLKSPVDGNIGISVSRGTIFIHDCTVAFPPPSSGPGGRR